MTNIPAAPPVQWRLPILVLVGAVALLLWQYRSTLSAMVAIWDQSATFTHAYLVPPISAWLVWRKRHEVAALTPRPQPWTLVPMALCGLGWLVGEMAGVNAVTQLAATALLVLTVPALLGWTVARALAFPICFLFFMVPIGDFTMPTLMDWTADVTVLSLRALGIPVYREGLQFVIPSGTWSVVEACSGVRFLIASFMVGTLFAYLNYNSTKRRLAFALVSLVVPIVANWGRALMIVLIGHLSNNELAVGVDHLVYGWVFFGVVIGLMFFIGSRWAEPEGGVAAGLSAGRSGPVGGRAPDGLVWAALAGVVLVLIGPGVISDKIRGPELNAPQLHLPDLAGESADSSDSPLFTPTFQRPVAQAWRTYGQGSSAVTVHVAYYRQQTFGRKLVSSQNSLVSSNDTTWRRTARGSAVLPVGEETVTVKTAELRAGELGGVRAGGQLQVRQVYWVAGRWTSSDQLAVLLGLLGQLSGQGDDAAAVTFISAAEGPQDGTNRLDGFVSTHLGSLSTWLETVRAGR